MRIGIACWLGSLVCAGCVTVNQAPEATGGAGTTTGGGATGGATPGASSTAVSNGGSGGVTTAGALTATGGTSEASSTAVSNGGSGGATTAQGTGGSTTTGGSATGGNAPGGTSSVTTSVVGPGTYARGAPNQCTSQFSIDGCKKGVATSTCEGVCSSDYGSGAQSACEAGKSGVPVNFACPRFLLYSDEFNQAAVDDGYTAFNYGIVGHDADVNGVDSGLSGACCQCYQIVFDYPKENQVWVDPNNSTTPQSALPPPKTMIVQSFNTGTAGPGNFDIYMGAGGLGANNGCFSIGGSSSPAGLYQYTGYPAAGQPGGGGVKAAGEFGNNSACKTSTSWVTEATIGSAGCVDKVTTACNQILATDPQQQAAARRSCIQSNAADSFYHLNWYFWVKRVECPSHLTEVTGCKLAPQGLPAADPAVATVAQAKAAGFRQKDGTGQPYFTTTMEDCCMPTCAWRDNVKGATVGNYNSFYSCNQAGIPQTE